MLNPLTILPAAGVSGLPGEPRSTSTGFASVLGGLLSGTAPPPIAGRAAAPALQPTESPPLGEDLPQSLGLPDGQVSDLALLAQVALPLQPVLNEPLKSGLTPPLDGPPLSAVDLPEAPAHQTPEAHDLSAGGSPVRPNQLPLMSDEPALGDHPAPGGPASPNQGPPATRPSMPGPERPVLALEGSGGLGPPLPGRLDRAMPGQGRERTANRSSDLPADRLIEPGTNVFRSGPAATTVSGPVRMAASTGATKAVEPLPPAVAGAEMAATGTGFELGSDPIEGLRAGERTSTSQEPGSVPRAPASPATSQIEIHLARAAHGRIDRLVVQLEPLDLGKVEIRLEFGDEGRVGAVISAERPETLEALQRDAQALERSLRDAGLRPDGGGLSFDLKRGSSDRQHADHGRPPLPATDVATADAGPLPESRLTSLRLLDIQA